MNKKTIATLCLSITMILMLALIGCAGCGGKKGGGGNGGDTDTAKYTVTFDSRGGSAVDSVEIEAGGKIKQPDDPTMDNGTFIGWFTDPENDNSEWNFITGKVTGNMTLYAMWNVQYMVYFYNTDESSRKKNLPYVGGWTYDYETSASIAEGATVRLPDSAITPGYIYDAWYTDEECTNLYTPGTITANLNLYSRARFLDSWDFATQGKGWWQTRVENGKDDGTSITEEEDGLLLTLHSDDTEDVGMRIDGLRIPVEDYAGLRIRYKCLGNPYRVNVYYATSYMTEYTADKFWYNTSAIRKGMERTDDWETLIVDLAKFGGNYRDFVELDDLLQTLRIDFPLVKAGDTVQILFKDITLLKNEDMAYPTYEVQKDVDENLTEIKYDFARNDISTNAGTLGWQAYVHGANTYYRNNTLVNNGDCVELDIKQDATVNNGIYPSIDYNNVDFSIDLEHINTLTVTYKATNNITRMLLRVIPEGKTAHEGTAWYEFQGSGITADAEWQTITVDISDYGKQTVHDGVIQSAEQYFVGKIGGLRMAFAGEQQNSLQDADATVLIKSIVLGGGDENARIISGTRYDIISTGTPNKTEDDAAGTLTWDFSLGNDSWSGRNTASSNVIATRGDDCMRVHLEDDDAGIWLRGAEIDADAYKYLTVRFSSSIALDLFRAYFANNDAASNFAANPCMGTTDTIPAYQQTGGTLSNVSYTGTAANTELVVMWDLTELAEWTGKVTGLRIDLRKLGTANRDLSIYKVTFSKDKPSQQFPETPIFMKVDEEAGTLTWDFSLTNGDWTGRNASGEKVTPTRGESCMNVALPAAADGGILLDNTSINTGDYRYLTVCFSSDVLITRYRMYWKEADWVVSSNASLVDTSGNNSGYATPPLSAAQFKANAITEVVYDLSCVTSQWNNKTIKGLRIDFVVGGNTARNVSVYEIVLSKKPLNVTETADKLIWDFSTSAGEWKGRNALSSHADIAFTADTEKECMNVDLPATQNCGIWVRYQAIDSSLYDKLTIRFKSTEAITMHRAFTLHEVPSTQTNPGYVSAMDTDANNKIAQQGSANADRITISDPDADGIITVSYNLKDSAAWTGTINTIRIDFVPGGNTARVISIYDITLSKVSTAA